MRSPFRPWLHRLACLLALVLVAALEQPGSAWAHASLNATEPRDGAVTQTAPRSYSLVFSEPVSPLSLQLVERDGSVLPLDRFAVSGNVVEIEAPAGLGPGTHVLSWRVISEDGHPIGGSIVFSIGQASAAPQVAEQVERSVTAGLWVGKVALYVGLFFGAGGAFAVAWLVPAFGHGRRFVLAAVAVGVFGTLASAAFQGLDALAAPLARIADPVVWSAGMGTSFGRTVVAAALALAAATAGVLTGQARARLFAVGALALTGAALALSGHASAAEPQWLMRPMVFLHAVTIALWVGALAPLGLALKRRAPEASAALRRFSAAIPFAVVVLLVSGTVLAFVQVGRPAALTQTAYGRVLLVKLALLALLLMLAAANRWVLTVPAEAGKPSAPRWLVRAIAVEILLVLLIVGVAALWRFTPPPRALAAAAIPASVHIHTARAMADVTLTPGRAGPVDVAATILSGESEPLDAKEVSFVFAHPAAGIEPIRRSATRTGDGTWRTDAVVLPLAGTWKLRIDILIDDFEIVRLQGEAELGP